MYPLPLLPSLVSDLALLRQSVVALLDLLQSEFRLVATTTRGQLYVDFAVPVAWDGAVVQLQRLQQVVGHNQHPHTRSVRETSDTLSNRHRPKQNISSPPVVYRPSASLTRLPEDRPRRQGSASRGCTPTQAPKEQTSTGGCTHPQRDTLSFHKALLTHLSQKV